MRRPKRAGASYMKWTAAEDQALRDEFATGSPRTQALCKKLGRSPGAIYMRAIRIGAWKFEEPQ